MTRTIDVRPKFARVLEEYECIRNIEDATKWVKKNNLNPFKAQDFLAECEYAFSGEDRMIVGALHGHIIPRFSDDDSCMNYIDWMRRQAG